LFMMDSKDGLSDDLIDQEIKRLKDKINTYMYSPVSGSMMSERFLSGFIACETLIKFADAAVKACSGNGMRNVVTRQAMGSSATGGASRLGKMEIDSQKQHAAIRVLDSILKDADIYHIHCCKLHGRLETKSGYCPKCQSGANVGDLAVPYSLLLASDHMCFLNMFLDFIT